MNIEDHELESALRKSLTTNITGDVATIGDALTGVLDDKNSILPHVPFLGYLHAVYEVSASIKQYHFIKKTGSFFSAFFNNELSDEEISKFKEEMEDHKKFSKTKEFLLIQIDRFNDQIRSAYFGNLFAAYVSRKISWEQLCDYSFVIEKMDPRGFKYLTFYMENGIIGSHARLPPGAPFFYGAGMVQRHGSNTRFEPWAENFYKHAIKKLKPNIGDMNDEMREVISSHQRYLDAVEKQNKKNSQKKP